eukprot:5506930-Pyramimonas_sp.AAC.1
MITSCQRQCYSGIPGARLCVVVTSGVWYQQGGGRRPTEREISPGKILLRMFEEIGAASQWQSIGREYTSNI